jgi:mono/diheme cytochrome c family protein
VGKFFLGVLVTLIVLLGGGYIYLRLGFLSFRADQKLSSIEKSVAMSFVDASIDRHAPEQKNPVQPTEPNLIAGVSLYKDNCAACHGAPSHSEEKFGHPFYPPAPQFMKHAPEMPEYENFYIIQHGSRWTGMPAWKNTLSTQRLLLAASRNLARRGQGWTLNLRAAAYRQVRGRK